MNFKSLLALILIGLLLFGSYYLFSMEEESQEAKTAHSFEEILARLQAQDKVEAEQEADAEEVTINNDEPTIEDAQEDTQDVAHPAMKSDVETNDQPVEDSCQQDVQEEN